ncbi:MAG: endo-1,4-beta-xylanase [Bryobacteraceae bacterium]
MLRHLGSLLLACGIAAAQQTSPVLATDPFACFAMSAPSPAGDYAELRTVDVNGPGFTQAFHLTTKKLSANAWDIRIRCFQTLAARENDTILARFWMRTISPQAADGYTTFVVEKGADPWTKSISYTASAKSEWKLIEIPFQMLENYVNGRAQGGADTYNLSFWVNFGPQEIEIGGLTIQNYGQNYSFWDLGLTNWPYEGWAQDASWRAAAAARIEHIRKADIAVVVRDDAGNPVPNAPVHVKMKRHAFGFGSAVAGQMLMQASADRETYRQYILQMFNQVVLENDLKWPPWESSPSYAVPALEWLRANGITDIRGHNLIWPGRANLPTDVVQMLDATPVNQQTLRDRIHNHFIDILGATRGMLTDWDVINEPYANRDVQAVLGDAEMAQWFRWARELAPGVKLFVNEYNILEAGGMDLAHQDGVYNIVQFILDNGGPVDGVGLQSHFDLNLTPPERVLEVLDRFAQLGKELKVTEFDVSTTDERLQADYTRDFLTATFSHPSITGFLMWGFWEGADWRPSAAMVRRDWTTKLNYEVWMDLIYRQWWTDVEGTTGADGVFRTRGFLGDYDITASGQTLPLTVARGQVDYALVGRQTAGAINPNGVVNAASFLRGPVAPGEIVEFWGLNYGATTPVLGFYDSGQLAAFGGDTRVLFDGVPAPLIHTMRWDQDPNVGRVAAIVPYSVSGTTNVEVEYLGTKTPAVAVPVVDAAPAVFCYSGGTGQAVAVNHHPDGTLSFNRDAALERGGYLEFFITGEGRTDPPGIDGRLPVYPDNPRPVAPVVVKIGGVESRASECPYNWTGLVYAGVTQINACVPAGAPTGEAVSLEVTVGGVGGVATQAGVTVRIK